MMGRGQNAQSTFKAPQVHKTEFNRADRVSKGIFSSFFETEDGQNPNCLNAITTYSKKTETWLVFVVHGLSSNGNVEWVINLGESIRGR